MGDCINTPQGMQGNNDGCRQIYSADFATSCYGAPYNKICSTCGDVIDAYKKKNWALDPRHFLQCKNQVNGSFNRSCSGIYYDVYGNLTATCQNSRGGSKRTSIYIGNCGGDISNRWGTLSC